MNAASLPVVAILGGTGALGSALARRWAAAGCAVIVGSRDRVKAAAAAEAINAMRPAHPVRGDTNVAAAQAGDIVVVSVPFASHAHTLDEIRASVTGKIVVDAVVPLVPPKVSVVQLPAEGSAGAAAQARLGDGVRVVSAFHTVGAAKLASGAPLDSDVLVFGNDAAAKSTVIELIALLGLRGLDGGPIANSVAAESLTSVLIGINRRFGVRDAGIRITGVDPAAVRSERRP